MDAIQVPVNQLKAGLSRYLSQARAGQVIEVPTHNKPIARLTGIAAPPADGLALLLANGGAQWAGGKPAPAPAVALPGGGRSVGAMVLEDRG